MKKNYLSQYEAPALEIIEVKIEQGFAASPFESTNEDMLDDGIYEW